MARSLSFNQAEQMLRESGFDLVRTNNHGIMKRGLASITLTTTGNQSPWVSNLIQKIHSDHVAAESRRRAGRQTLLDVPPLAVSYRNKTYAVYYSGGKAAPDYILQDLDNGKRITVAKAACNAPIESEDAIRIPPIAINPPTIELEEALSGMAVNAELGHLPIEEQRAILDANVSITAPTVPAETESAKEESLEQTMPPIAERIRSVPLGLSNPTDRKTWLDLTARYIEGLDVEIAQLRNKIGDIEQTRNVLQSSIDAITGRTTSDRLSTPTIKTATEPKRTRRGHKRQYITDALAASILQLWTEGKTANEIGQTLKISPNTVYRYNKGTPISTATG